MILCRRQTARLFRDASQTFRKNLTNVEAKRPREDYPPKKYEGAPWRTGASCTGQSPVSRTLQTKKTRREHPGTDETSITTPQLEDLIAATRFSRIRSPIAGPASPWRSFSSRLTAAAAARARRR